MLLTVPFAFAGADSASATPANVIAVVAGTGTQGTPTAGPALSSALSTPTGVARDSSGNLYIADKNAHVVEKVNPSGQLSIFAGGGVHGASTTPRAATQVYLQFPDAVAVDSSGDVYIVDNSVGQVDEVDTSGQLTLIAGVGGTGAPTAGPAVASHLDYPSGVAVDSSGNVFIADAYNNVVEKVDTSGNLSVYAGTGTPGAPTAGPAASSALNDPTGVAVDSSGDLFIADSGNNVVEEVSPSGSNALSVIAGDGTAGTPTVGIAVNSHLHTPVGVAFANGDLYVDDFGNFQIEVVDLGTGNLSVLAGTGTQGSVAPGDSTMSDLGDVGGIGVGGGNLYLADWGNHVVTEVGAPIAPAVTTNPVSTSAASGTTATCTAAASGFETPTCSGR